MSEATATGYSQPYTSLHRVNHGDWRARLSSLIARHCQQKARDASRTTSRRTQEKAYENVMRLFGWLRVELGFKGLSNPMSLDARHFEALAVHIKEKRERGDFGAAQAAGYATYSRHLARWIGKPELVTVFGKALGRQVCKRQLIAQTDKSWQAAGVDPEQIILAVAQHERWVAMVLCAQHAFGLRKMEAMMLKPLRDILLAKVVGGDKGEWLLVHVHIQDGSKGGRPRLIPVSDPVGLRAAQFLREEIEWMGDREHLPPPSSTLKQNCKTYERTVRRFGITKNALGVTGHGLRTAYACNQLESAGITPTVRGGDGQHQDPVQQQVAYKMVTEAMGHGRVSVIGAYAGCITPQSAARREKALQRATQAAQANQPTQGVRP